MRDTLAMLWSIGFGYVFLLFVYDPPAANILADRVSQLTGMNLLVLIFALPLLALAGCMVSLGYLFMRLTRSHR